VTAPNERPTELDVSLLMEANEIESRSSNLLLNPSPGDLGEPSNVIKAGFKGTCAQRCMIGGWCKLQAPSLPAWTWWFIRRSRHVGGWMLHESRLLQADWLNGHLNNGMPSRVVSTNPIVNLIRTHQIQGRTPMVSMMAFAMPFDALDIKSVCHITR
jgi:hypothetical protein